MRPIPRLACVLALAALTGCGDDDPDPEPAETTWSTAFALDDAALLSVWGPAAHEIYAVGGLPDRGLARRFDGRAWSDLTVPDGPLLNWVHGCGDTLWMVGNDGRALRRVGDGAFEAVDTGETQDLWGVWCAAPDRAWAVGGDAAAVDGAPDPVVIEWDGAAWHRIALPALDREIRAFFKVWGTGPDHVFAVGAKGVIVRWNGTAWQQQLAGTTRDFVSLWGRAPDDIVAVGGRANGMVARYDGVTWTSVSLDTEPGMNGVWVDAAGTAHIVGLRGRILRMAPGGFDYERERYTEPWLLHAIWGTDGGRLYAVGGTLDQTPPWQGIALRGDR
ncbi:MAG: hypothetical protein R3F65_29700 [bacterium]